MKRKLAFSAAVLVLFAVAFVALQATAAPRSMHAIKHRAGSITIEEWLHASPAISMHSMTTNACFTLKGVLVD
ncbi:MAG: hypothetical protein ABSC36_04535 [Gaiellaceae bacterium]